MQIHVSKKKQKCACAKELMVDVFEILSIGIGTEMRSFCHLTNLEYQIQVGKMTAEVKEEKY